MSAAAFIPTFIGGMIAGVIILLGILVALAARRDVVAAKKTARPSTDANLTAMSQRYFGMIATRDSIHEARKLANKALSIIDEAKR